LYADINVSEEYNVSIFRAKVTNVLGEHISSTFRKK
jgi:hypothetical protein